MNKVKLTGVFMGAEFSHETHRETFYTGDIVIKRRSGAEDIIPLTISERVLDKMCEKGQRVTVIGEYRSYNKECNGKSRCILYVFVKEVQEPSEYDENSIEIEGFICRNLGTRYTPQNRKITDIIVAINRVTGKSDYIPCIVWNDKAEYVASFDLGTKVSLLGRIQSRVYDKMTESGVQKRTAYEVSVSEIGKIDPIEDIEPEDDFEDLFGDLDEE